MGMRGVLMAGLVLATACSSALADEVRPASGAAQPPLSVVVDTGGFDGGPSTSATDGRLFASLSSGEIKLWDIATGRLIRIIPPTPQVRQALALLPGGRQMLVSGDDGVIELLDLSTGATIQKLRDGEATAFSAMALAPDGSFAVLGGYGNTALVLDIARFEVRSKLAGHTEWIDAVALSPDGKRAATASADKTIRIWSPADGSLLSTIAVPAKVTWLAFLADGAEIVTIDEDKAMKVWSLADGRLARTLMTDYDSTALVSGDGKRIVVGASQYGDIFDVIDATTGKPVALDGKPKPETSIPSFGRYLSSVTPMPGGSRVLVNSGRTLEVYDLDTGAIHSTVESKGTFGAYSRDYAVSPLGRLLATISESEAANRNEVRLWDLSTGLPLRSIASDKADARSVRFSPEGSQLAVVDLQSSIRIHEVATGKLLSSFRTKPASQSDKIDFSGKEWEVKGLAFTPDRQHVLAWHNKTVRVYEARSGKLLRTLKGIASDVAGIEVAPDSALALIAEEKGAKLIDIQSGRTVRELANSHNAKDGRFSLDGKRLVVRDSEELTLYEVATGKLITTFKQSDLLCWTLRDDGKAVFAGKSQLSEIDLENGRPTRIGEGTGGGQSIWHDGCQLAPAGDAIATVESTGAIGIRSARTGALRAQLYSGTAENWLMIAPQGAFTGSPSASASMTVVRGLEIQNPALLASVFDRADLVKAALAGDPDGALAEWTRNTNPAAGTASREASPVAVRRFLGPALAPVAIKPLAAIGKPRIVPNQSHTAGINAIALSNDSRLLASVSYDKLAKLWDVASGRLIRSFEGAVESMETVALSPDTSRIAAGDSKGGISVWAVESGELVKQFKPFETQIKALAWSADGRWLVVANGATSEEKLAYVRIFDAADWTPVRELKLEGYEDVKSLKFLRDGRHLAVAHRAVTIWDTMTGETVRSYESGGGELSVSPDGETIAVEHNAAVHLYDVNAGLIRSTQAHSDYIYGSTFSRDGKIVYARDGKDFIIGWDVGSGRKTITVKAEKGDSGSGNIGPILPNGKQYITYGNEIVVRDLDTGARVRSIGEDVDSVNSLALLPEGNHIVSGGGAAVRSWDIVEGARTRSYDTAGQYVNEVRLTRDAKRLLLGHSWRLMRVVDVETGRELGAMKDTLPKIAGKDKMDPIMRMIRETQANVDSRSMGFDITPDGSQAALGRNDGTIKIYDPRTGALRREIQKAADGFVAILAYTPDGRELISGGSDHMIRVWDPRTGKAVRTLEGHRWAVRSATFFDGGRRLLTGSGDRTMIVWDFAAGQPLRTIEAHLGVVRAVAVSRDGTRAVSGGTEGAVKLWDLTTGELLRTFLGHLSEVNAVALSADARHVVSGSADGSMRVWSAESGELLATFITAASGEWLVITPEGFFSASKNGAQILSVVHGSEVIGIDRFYDALNRPDLVRDKLADLPDSQARVRAAAARLDLDTILASGRAPRMAIVSHPAVSTAASERVNIEATITDQGGGIGKVEWRHNGRTVGVQLPGSVAEARVRQPVDLSPGENRIEVLAYNARGLVTSEPAAIVMSWNGPPPAAKPRLFIVAVGINDYFDTKLKLNLAVADAHSIGEGLREAGKDLYGEAEIIYLLDKSGTEAKLDRTFKALAEKVRANDVFMFFAAGHGVTEDGRYYFIPQDFVGRTSDALVKQGIGQDKLQAWFAKMPNKSILMFDTCESGTLTNSKRGNEHIAAVQRLNRATGRVTLTAAMDDQPAQEGYRGHGVFTFAILDALARADRNDNGGIEVTELIQHIGAMVPEITEKRWGAAQIPRHSFEGSDFTVARQLATLSPSPSDEPIISMRPTHVAILPTEVFQAAAKGKAIEKLGEGTLLTLVKTKDGWSLVARNGRAIGYVPSQTLLKVQ